MNKVKGPDGIPAKFVKILADTIDCHTANIINKDISYNKFSENALQHQFLKMEIEPK